MKTVDCWDFLIARRTIADTHSENDNVFPIAENVAKVCPEDVLVSDYYDGNLLKQIVPKITGLNNEIVCTSDGKYAGWLWNELKKRFTISEHLGDNPHSDRDSPNKYGIKATITVLSPFTDIEKEIDNLGLHGLARTMRETRLITWHDKFRQLQLVQSQVNLPMLFAASVLLHRTKPQRLLMVTRDCCLWQHMQVKVRDMFGGNYEVVYFKTSRVAIASANEEYMEYVNGLLPATIVDYATGPNKSLLKLVNKSKYPDTPIITIVHQPAGDRIQGFLNIEPRSVHPEFMNLDRHPMYASHKDVFNPANIDWENIPEIVVMHDTFMKACDITKYYDFSSDLNVSDDVLKNVIQKSLWRATDYAPAFAFTAAFSSIEHNSIIEYISIRK